MKTCKKCGGCELNDIDTFLDIIKWLKNRYRRADGGLILYLGETPSTYSKMELLFFHKYIKLPISENNKVKLRESEL